MQLLTFLRGTSKECYQSLRRESESSNGQATAAGATGFKLSAKEVDIDLAGWPLCLRTRLGVPELGRVRGYVRELPRTVRDPDADRDSLARLGYSSSGFRSV